MIYGIFYMKYVNYRICIVLKKSIDLKYFSIKEAILEDMLKDVDFTAVMSSWMKQKGHPVVTVRRMGSNRIGITQNRFITDTTVDVAQLRE